MFQKRQRNLNRLLQAGNLTKIELRTWRDTLAEYLPPLQAMNMQEMLVNGLFENEDALETAAKDQAMRLLQESQSKTLSGYSFRSSI